MNSKNANCSDFEKLLKDYINKLDEIIDKLNDLLKTIACHHQNCNIAKTAGTAVSSTGVVVLVGSVLLSPFTGGTSLVLGTSGAVMSITGGLSNVITDYVDYKTTSTIMNDIQLIVNSKQEFDENLKDQLKNFVKVIEKLMEQGLDKYSATTIAIKGVASGCIDLTKEPNMKLMNTLSTIIKMHHIEAVALDALPIIGKTIHISEKTFQFINRIFGIQSGAAVFKMLGQVTSVISVVFTIVDVTLLIRDWMAEHPTVEVVSETIKQLQEEKQILSDFLEVIESSRDKVDLVLQAVIKDIEEIESKNDDFENDFVFVPKEIES